MVGGTKLPSSRNAELTLETQAYSKLERISRPLLSKKAYEVIRGSILSGQMKPGTWLRQEFLAEKLEVSQATIREALNRLVTEGLVAHVPHKGVKVVAITVDTLEDIYDMRALLLEGLANELAATKLSARELARMRKVLPHILLTPDSPSIETAREADREFHWIVIRATERDHLIRMLEQLWVLIDPYMIYGRFWNMAELWGQRIKASKLDLQDHTQLLEALEAREGGRARQITEEYVHRAFQELEQQILEAQMPEITKSKSRLSERGRA